MTFKIFTYGSLLNLNSLSRTLGRDVAKDEFIAVILDGYGVSWGYGTTLEFEDKEQINGVFLTLTPELGKSAVGAVFSVSSAEFENLKKREKGYEILKICAKNFSPFDKNTNISPNDEIYAFGTSQKEQISGVIAQNYLKMLNTAIQNFSPKFQEIYSQNVLKNLPFSTKNGEYKFTNAEQNSYAKGEF